MTDCSTVTISDMTSVKVLPRCSLLLFIFSIYLRFEGKR